MHVICALSAFSPSHHPEPNPAMTEPSSECSSSSETLEHLARSLRASDDVKSWVQVEASAQALANALRVKNGPGA
jgi:hypothetical protein